MSLTGMVFLFATNQAIRVLLPQNLAPKSSRHLQVTFCRISWLRLRGANLQYAVLRRPYQ